MAFRTLTYIEQMKAAEIVELTYTQGQRNSSILFSKIGTRTW